MIAKFLTSNSIHRIGQACYVPTLLYPSEQVQTCFLIGLLFCEVPDSILAQKLVWSDEFNGPKGVAPDPAKWVYDLGASGWGNDELQNYTDSRENSFQDGNGHLVLRALKQEDGGYTSARLKTKGLFTPQFGRIEARMKLPYGQGIWPAFWMLGEGFPETRWPDCGEIDIMEHVGKEPLHVYGTLHGPGYSGDGGLSAKLVSRNGRPFQEEFHVYAVDWRAGSIRFLVDGEEYARVEKGDLPAGTKWVFDQPYFLLINRIRQSNCILESARGNC